MRRSIALFVSLLVLISLSGCAAKSFYAKSMQAPSPDMGVPLSNALPEFTQRHPDLLEVDPNDTMLTQLAAGVDESKKAADRILIYTATLTMSVADVEAGLASAQKITSGVGGYMQTLTGESITIRIPAESFFRVLEQLRTLGTTLSKQVNAQDVTDEYVDLQLRLRNAEALRERLEAILQQAKTVKDTLEVEKELNRVREEIERIKGRLVSLEKQVRFSTITLSLVRATEPVVKQHRPQTPFPWLDRLGVETVLNIGE